MKEGEDWCACNSSIQAIGRLKMEIPIEIKRIIILLLMVNNKNLFFGFVIFLFIGFVIQGTLGTLCSAISFDGNTRITNSSFSGYPHAGYANSTVGLTWQGNESETSKKIYYGYLNESSMSWNLKNIYESTEEVKYPDLIADNSGNVNIVWQDKKDGIWNVYYKNVDIFGNDISNAVSLTDSMQGVSENSITPNIGTNKNVLGVVWKYYAGYVELPPNGGFESYKKEFPDNWSLEEEYWDPKCGTNPDAWNGYAIIDTKYRKSGSNSAYMYSYVDACDYGYHYTFIRSSNTTIKPEYITFWIHAPDLEVEINRYSHKIYVKFCADNDTNCNSKAIVDIVCDTPETSWGTNCNPTNITKDINGNPNYNGSDAGSDGNIWYRYTVKWDDSIYGDIYYFKIGDFTLRWDGGSGDTSFYLDDVCFSDEKGTCIGGTGNQSYNKGVYLRSYYNGTWQDPVLLVNSSGAKNPKISFDEYGQQHIAWIDDRDLNSEVYYKYENNTQSGNIGYLDSDVDGLYDTIERGWTNCSEPYCNDIDPSTTTDYTNYDTDGDGLPDGRIDGWAYNPTTRNWGVNYSSINGVIEPWEGEDLNLNGKFDSGETNPNNNDTDGDNLPDGWEVWYGLNASSSTGNDGKNGDPEGDGLLNKAEFGNGTSPVNNDTDGDGLNDSYEVNNAYGLNATNPDTDNDGLSDFVENFYALSRTIYGDNYVFCAINADSDGDGVLDGSEKYEVKTFWVICKEDINRHDIFCNDWYFVRGVQEPFNDTDHDGRMNMLDWDSDNDGLSDGIEFKNGTKSWRPVEWDSDGDGLSDGSEVFGHQYNAWRTTNPENPDTDGDGLWDGNVTRNSTYRMYYYGELNQHTDPVNIDTDSDGLSDGLEIRGWATYGLKSNELYNSFSDPLDRYTDADTIDDYDEYSFGYNANNTDTDGDGLSDAQEDVNRNGIVDVNETCALNPDTDGDGLWESYEIEIGTDPLNSDTDGDGFSDGEGNWTIFRTNAIDVNSGKTINESFNDTGNSFEIKYVADHIASAKAFMEVQKSKLLSYNSDCDALSDDEYCYGLVPPVGAEGWVKIGPHNQSCTVEAYYYSSFMGGIYSWSCNLNVSEYNCSMYEMDTPPINVTLYWYETGEFNLGYVNCTDVDIIAGKAWCQLPNTTWSEMNDTQYTYDTRLYNGQFNNNIITGHSFSPANNESLTINYAGGDEIDYAACENTFAWIAFAANFSLDSKLKPMGGYNNQVYFVDDNYIISGSGDMDKEANTYEGYPVYYNESGNFAIIDVPGNRNPVYKTTTSMLYYNIDLYYPYEGGCQVSYESPELTRGLISKYSGRHQERYDSLFVFDPLNYDTNNDGLPDPDEYDLVFVYPYSYHTTDHDHDLIPDWIDNDSDSDGVLDGEEPLWNKDIDNDGRINALDNDSDNDTLLDGNEVLVVFRTNSSRERIDLYVGGRLTHLYVNLYKNSWAGVQNDSGKTSLNGYVFNSNVDGNWWRNYYNLSNISFSKVTYGLLGEKIPLQTPDNYDIYIAGDNTLYIDLPDVFESGGYYYKSSQDRMAKFTAGSIPVSGRNLTQPYASSHKEVYDGTYALSKGNDADNDGLVFGTDPNDNNRDIDGDGLIDSKEFDWNNDTDGDSLKNYADLDSDNDGLPDGWIDGWCYNETRAKNHEHAPGSIDGFGVWCDSDGIVRQYEGEDTDLNGRYTTYPPETNPLSPDTDSDGLLDGEELLTYNTNPITGGGIDGDGLSDYSELFDYFAVDTIFIPDYVNESAFVDRDGNGEWRAYFDYPLILQIKITLRGEYKIYGGDAVINMTISNGTFSVQEDFVSGNDTLDANLSAGIYNLTIKRLGGYVKYVTIKKKGCNVTNSDSDNDGIIDGSEIGSPLDRDSDNDGLLDGEEQKATHGYLTGSGGIRTYTDTISSPIKMDTDGDGISDKYDSSPKIYGNWGFSTIYPKSSITQARMYRGWGLDGESWIEHLFYTDYRGHEDVKVSNMLDEYTVKDMISRTLPPVYGIESVVDYGYCNMENNYATYHYEPAEGTPDTYIRYDYICRYYEANLKNTKEAYRNSDGSLSTDSNAYSPGELMRYLTFDMDIDENKDQFFLFTYSIDPDSDEYYYMDDTNYSIPAFEYKIYYDNGTYYHDNVEYNLTFGNYPMNYALIADEGMLIASTVEYTPTRHAYSVKVPVTKEIAKQSDMHLYLSPVYVVKPGGMTYFNSNGVKVTGNGTCDLDRKIVAMNTDSFKMGSIEKILPGYAYKIVSKLNGNITYIDNSIPGNFSEYSTGVYNIAGIEIYVFKGSYEEFNISGSGILSHDAFAVISATETEVNKILNEINLTDEWYYNTTNQFNESMRLKQFKSVTEVKISDLIDSFFIDYIGLYLRGDVQKDVILARINPESEPYNYSVSYVKTKETPSMIKTTHTVNELLNDLGGIGPDNLVFEEIKNQFKNESSYSVLSTDGSNVAIIAPQNTEQTAFKTFSYYVGLGLEAAGYGTTAYSTFKTTRDLTGIVKSKDALRTAKITDFMTPDVGPAEYIDFAIIGIDLALTWGDAYKSNDKFVTKAAVEHTVASGVNLGISIAGIAFPPAGVIGVTWTGTYYATNEILDLFGVERGPFTGLSSDPGAAIVFSYEVFTGVTVPAEVCMDAFQSAEDEVFSIYMDNEHYVNRKKFSDEVCGNISISPYYPQFYIDPRDN